MKRAEVRFNKKMNHRSKTRLLEEADNVLDNDLHEIMKSLAGENGFDYFAYTEIAGDTIGFNLKYNSDATI